MKLMTTTFALIIAGGAAAGIALARPGAPSPAPVAAEAAPAADAAPAGAGGYGTGRSVGRNPQAAAQPEAAPSVAAAPAEIEIRNFAFEGATTAAPGQQLNITNLDGAPHTFTFTSGEGDTGSIAGGASGTLNAPAAPGTYQFFCTIHPSMQGELVVQG